MNLSLLVTALIMSASTTTTAKDLPISGSRLRGTTKEYQYQATSNLKDSGYDSKLLAVAKDHHGPRDSTSEDYDEDWAPENLPFLLAGGSKDKCDCDSDNHCGSGYYCAKSNCSPDPAYETHKRCECNRDSECPSGKYCKELICNFGNGISYGRCAEKTKKYSGLCVKKGPVGPRVCDFNLCNAASGDFDKCECSRNESCVRGIASCTGKACCASEDHRNEPRACSNKQCNNKDNSSKCQCGHHESCVKNSNACHKTGDLNGCCLSDFEAIAGLFIQVLGE